MFPPASLFKSHFSITAQFVLASVALVLFAQPTKANAQSAADAQQRATVSTQSAAAPAQNDPLVVPTTAGLIRGIARAKGNAQFLGIPYIDDHLADLMETYWTNFAKTGDPNSSGDPNSAAQPHWPEFDAAQLYLIFTEDGQGVASVGPMRAPQCDLYRDPRCEHEASVIAKSSEGFRLFRSNSRLVSVERLLLQTKKARLAPRPLRHWRFLEARS